MPATNRTALANDWPNEEIRSRIEWQSVYVGLPTAFFSGLGVAVSLLDDSASSLVGVAISASLLPPAVNAGIVWMTYTFYDLDLLGTEFQLYLYEEQEDGSVAKLFDREQFIKAGAISLTLTISNIFLIWASSMIMFRIKEVLPIRKKPFWGDLGIARKIYQRKALLRRDLQDEGGTSIGADSG